ncbi:MAG: DUF481 domain-containing protein [Myxococcales bacterium]|nr:MAG: DUF481 domain-containing protein [Myxococcales bacterium]
MATAIAHRAHSTSARRGGWAARAYRTLLAIGLLIVWSGVDSFAGSDAAVDLDSPPVETRSPPPATDSDGQADAGSATWKPTIPDDSADWVMMVSGEWLRGKLHRLREDTMEFESDELDDLTLDFEDIAGFRVGHNRVFVLNDRTQYTGRAVMQDGRIAAWTAEGKREFAREHLLSIVPAAERRLDLWDGKVSLGVSSTSGNTDQQDMSGFGYLRRSTSLTRLRFDYNGTVSIVSGSDNANNHRGTAKYDVFLSERWYLSPAILDVFSDVFQNVSLRITPSAAIGYHIFNTSKIEWDVEIGAGAQFTRSDSVPLDDNGQPLEDEDSLNGALITGTRLEWEITKRIDWSLSYRLQLGVPETDQRFQNLFTTLSLEITKILDVDLSLKFDRAANPPREADGTIPEENDVTVTFGFGLDF